MKLTKLLTGAAVAALLTGAANAQVAVTVGNYDGDAADTQYQASTTVASELNIASGAITGALEIQIDARDTNPGAPVAPMFDGLSSSNKIRVTIDLTGMELSSPATPTGVGGAQAAGCTMTLVSGGNAGGTQAVYELDAADDPKACDAAATDLEFDLPGVKLTAATGNFSVTVTETDGGTTLYTSAYDASPADLVTNPLVTSKPGFAPVIIASAVADRTVASAPTVSGGAAFNSFGAAATSGRVGSITISDGGTAGAATAGAAIALGTFAAGPSFTDVTAAAQVDDIDLTVCVADSTGLSAVVFSVDSSIATAGDQDSRTLASNCATTNLVNVAIADFDDAATAGNAIGDGVDIYLEEDASAATAISAQDLTATIALNLDTTNSNLADQTPSITGTLGRVTRAAATVTNPSFDWVGDASAVTRNVFRMTGVSAGSQIFVTISNATNPAFNGTYELVSSATPNGNEVIVTNAQIGGVVGAFGRADVSFDVVGQTGGVTAERLLVGNNGTLSELN